MMKSKSKNVTAAELEPEKKGKGVSLDDIRKGLKKFVPDSEPIAENTYSEITGWIHSGNYHLNALISGSLFKGYPNNKCIQFAGESGVGKTYLALNACREMQKAGYHILYFDSEGAIDLPTVIAQGIDPDRFDVQPVSEFNQFRSAVMNLAVNTFDAVRAGKSVPKVAVYLDSLGELPTAKEIKDALEGNDARDFTKPQVVRSLFRLITSKFTGAGIPFIYTNHTYGGPSQVPVTSLSGGQGQVYSPTAIITLSKAKLKESKENEKRQTGIIVTAKILKNRLAKPNEIKFHIDFSKGMNPFIGMEEYFGWQNCGIEKGIIYEEKEHSKLDAKEKAKCKEFDHDGKKLFFYPKETAKNYVVRHLGEALPFVKLFNEKVFTRQVLEMIEENCIVPKFQYGVDEEIPEIEEFMNEE